MARIDPQHLSWVLDNLLEDKVVNEIVVPTSIAQSAKIALDRMMAIV
jgi:quinolinate synthase